MTRKTIHQLLAFPHALISLASALVSTLTLGFYWPKWEFEFMVWETRIVVRYGKWGT